MWSVNSISKEIFPLSTGSTDSFLSGSPLPPQSQPPPFAYTHPLLASGAAPPPRCRTRAAPSSLRSRPHTRWVWIEVKNCHASSNVQRPFWIWLPWIWRNLIFFLCVCACEVRWGSRIPSVHMRKWLPGRAVPGQRCDASGLLSCLTLAPPSLSNFITSTASDHKSLTQHHSPASAATGCSQRGCASMAEAICAFFLCIINHKTHFVLSSLPRSKWAACRHRKEENSFWAEFYTTQKAQNLLTVSLGSASRCHTHYPRSGSCSFTRPFFL